MMRLGCRSLMFFAASLLAVGGCGPLFGLPSFCEPGSASQKLSDAKKFDPYPDPNSGPAVVGGRPQGFINPRPDPEDLTKRGPAPWGPAYPPAAISGPPVAYPAATGSYYPSATVVPPPTTSTYSMAPGTNVASSSPYVAPASSSPPSTAPALTPLGPPPAVMSPVDRSTGVPAGSYGTPAAPVAYGTKITAP